MMQRLFPRLAPAVAVLLLPLPAWAEGSDAFTEALSKGPLYAALAAWVGGLLVSLTPCVYPMVAVTVSVFGARQSRSRSQDAWLSSAFVLGIMGMFVPLGVAAGLTGTLFGSVLQQRWVLVGISLLFLVMAGAMFGAFELAVPSRLLNRLANVGGLGYRGAFGLGLVCGLIAAPCTGPVLAGILAFIAQSQSAALGAAAMSAFSLGLGLPFFLVGTFAVRLPKSGRWTVHVKSVLGIVLVVVALYYLSTTFTWLAALARPEWGWLALLSALALAGIALGAVHRDFADPGLGSKLLKGSGVLLTSGALFLLILGSTAPKASLDWAALDAEAARASALAERRPLLMDFTATWCTACKELDRHTFSDPRVIRETSRFVAVKVDATHDTDPKVEETLARFEVRGLPTVLVFDSQGREVLRYQDFVTADRLLSAIQAVR
jgi:thiol:disulfide interchange protein DsbD